MLFRSPGEIVYMRTEEDHYYFYLNYQKSKTGFICGYFEPGVIAFALGRCENKIKVYAAADLAITGLTEGWIKKENFRYEEEQ